MENYLVLIILFFAGYGLRHLSVFPRDTASSLNLFIIYVSLPALVLYQVPRLVISSDALVPVLMPWAMLAISALAVYALSRAFGWDRKVQGSLLLVVPLGNTSFLGIPMVTSFFGPDRVPYALLYDQFGSFLALTTYGTYVLALFGAGARPSLGEMARKVATFPPFIALAAALVTRSITYPPLLESALKTIAASLVPVVMVAIGFQLRLVIPRQYMAPLGIGLALKLLAAPVAAIALCRLLGLEGIAAGVSVFEAGMPPMVTAGALAILGGLATDLTAAMIGYGIVLSFITLPLLHRFIMYML